MLPVASFVNISIADSLVRNRKPDWHVSRMKYERA